MDKSSMHVTQSNKHKSELDKVKIYYEFATSASERNRLKRKPRRNDA